MRDCPSSENTELAHDSDLQINNADKAGNTIVSRITNTL